MNTIYVIVQQENLTTGHGQSQIVDLLATQSIYGGHFLPAFTSQDKAMVYLARRTDKKYRGLKIVKVDLM